MGRLTTIAALGLLVACGGTTEHSRHAQKQAGVPSRAEPSNETTCPVTGTWEGRVPGGPFAGETTRFQFEEGGAVTALAGPSPIDPSWSLYGNLLSVRDGTGSCSPEARASYELDFDPACTEMRIIAIEDPCDERRRTMDWLVLTRQ